MLPLRVKVDLGVMAIMKYIVFLKAAVLLELHYHIVSCHTGHSLKESYPSAKMQSVYSAAPAD